MIELDKPNSKADTIKGFENDLDRGLKRLEKLKLKPLTKDVSRAIKSWEGHCRACYSAIYWLTNEQL